MFNENEGIIVGEIDLFTPREIFLGEADKVDLEGSGKKSAGVCYIKVFGNEGDVPHFHITSKSNSKFYCCVCIYIADYFHHKPGEVNLTRDQAIILDTALRDGIWTRIHNTWQQAKVNSNKSAREAFERYCEDHNLDIKALSQPDYTTLLTD